MTVPSTDESQLTVTRNVINAGLLTLVNKELLEIQNDLEKREQAVRGSLKQLEEAKRAAPALFAQQGDLFEWLCQSDMYNETYKEPCVLEYLGRNETAPIPIQLNLGGVNFTRNSPEIGWLVFRYVSGQHINNTGYGIRYALDAFPQELFQHYDKGQADVSTICIPPEMCGSLKVAGDH